MPLNVGYVEVGGGGVSIRVYYDTAFTPVGDSQPLINGPRGFCLDVTNTSGKNVKMTISGLAANTITATVGQGDPVTSGGGRSRTVAVLNSAGFNTRGDLGQVSLEPA